MINDETMDYICILTKLEISVDEKEKTMSDVTSLEESKQMVKRI